MKTKTAFAQLRKTSLTLAVVAVLCSSAALNANAATSAPAFATVAHPTALRNGDALMGALPMSQPIHIEVALKIRDRTGLDAFIAANAKNQMQHVAPQLMTSDQFLANHAPTMAQAQAVANYLTGMGYTNVVIAPNRLLVSADGTAMTARNAFMTTFAQVKTHDGRIAFANTDDVRIPAALSDKILSVVGLQTVHQAYTFARPLRPDVAHTEAITGHQPTEFSSIYGGASVPSASNIYVGIVTEGKLNQTRTDLITFATNQGLAHVSTQEVDTNGTSNDTTNTAEWDLDSQNIVGMAGGHVGKLVFYNIPSLSNADLTADFNTIVTANVAKIVNVSLGECETFAQEDGSAAADDAIFATSVAQGQTLAVATGDHGADECGNGGTTPSWPASSSYVVSVGGTRLDASTTTWNSEVVWNRLSTGGGATGGGPSLFELQPSWQTALAVPGTSRDVADIAFDADPNSGSIIVLNGLSVQYGGTSLSAPLFSGIWARVLQKYRTIGFAAPVIYGLPAANFHDVTAGQNDPLFAGSGYDFPTGRGSMILSKVLVDANPVSTELLKNTSFETGTAAPWNVSNPGMLLDNSSDAHTGNWSLLLGYTTEEPAVDTLAQVVTIPAKYSKATLTFYLRSFHYSVDDAGGPMIVDVHDPVSKATLGTLAVIYSPAVESPYALYTFDMTPYIGKKVNLKFTRYHDNGGVGSDNSPFELDDINLTVK